MAAIAPLAYLSYDYTHYHLSLSGVAMDYSVSCDAECAEQEVSYEGRVFPHSVRCLEVEADRFVCRNQRGTGGPLGDACDRLGMCPEREVSRSSSAPPVTYGEVATILAGENVKGFFGIVSVDVLDAREKRIGVNFGRIDDGGEWGIEIAHVAQMVPGDTFLSTCDVRPAPHMVTYTDMYRSGDAVYAEFWGIHHLWTYQDPRPCDPGDLVDRTLQIEYGIDLPGYEEFGFPQGTFQVPAHVVPGDTAQ